MAKFQLHLLTPDAERGSYLVDTLSVFNGQFYEYTNNKNKETFSRWDPELCNEKESNWTTNEKFSVHQNAQKTLSFDMPTRRMVNNDWKVNIFIRKIHIGSLLLLIDKYDNHHVFVVNSIQTKLSDINTTYSYSCQDAFSYSLTRQNEGYFINNDPAEADFIGAKTIDWWANKIASECYIPDTYVKTNECLYVNFDGDLIVTEKSNEITDSEFVYKHVDQSANTIQTTTFSGSLSTTTDSTKPIFEELFAFSCSDSSALNALISLGEQVGYLLNVFERASITGSRAYIYRYFWFEPSKIETTSPYYYSPKKNIEKFSFTQAGSSLTTVLNVKSHTVGEELITLIPTPTPLFAQWFQSLDWQKTQYSRGFFTDHLDGKIWTTEGLNPSLNEVYGLEKEIGIYADNVAYYEEGGCIRIPITDYQKNTIELGYWDSKIQFSSPTRPTYFYIQHEDEGSIYTNKSFSCWLEIKDPDTKEFVIIEEHGEIPTRLKNRTIEMFLVFKNTFNGNISFYSAPEINLYSYTDVTEEDRQFAMLADKAPWLENKIIDFQYFVNKGVLTKREYQIIMDSVLNDLRIINGQLLCYAQHYQNAIKNKVTTLANLELAAETLHADLEQNGITPYFNDGAADDLSDFILKNTQLRKSYNSNTLLYGAQEIQNSYFNKYFSTQQRFLKNIHSFTNYFNSAITKEQQKSRKYTFTLTSSNDKFISFKPKNFISCASSTPVATDNFYTKIGEAYKLVSVATPDNITEFFKQYVQDGDYAFATDLKEYRYNSNCKYFIKKSSKNNSFIQTFLKDAVTVKQYTYDSRGNIKNTIEYYALNEDLLKNFYYYKLFMLYADNPNLFKYNKFYVKEKPSYVSIKDQDDLNTDTVYMKVGTSYKPIAYQNPALNSFNAWREKKVAEMHVTPYSGNPYAFMEEHDPGIYLTKGYVDTNNIYYLDAQSFVQSRKTRWQNKTFMDLCTYDNHYKYRVAIGGTIESENLSLSVNSWELQKTQDTHELFALNIRYDVIDTEGKTTYDLTGKENCYLGPDLGLTSVLACRRDFTPIALKESQVTVPKGYKIYQYKDFDEVEPKFHGSGLPINLDKFYNQTVYLNEKAFNPLTDSIIFNNDGTKTTYFEFLEVCNDLYVVSSDKIQYINATSYNEKEQYFKKLTDDSFVAVPSFDGIKKSEAYFIENSKETVLYEWGDLNSDEKSFVFKFYLNQTAGSGYHTFESLDLTKVIFKVEDNQIKNEPILLQINHLGQTYEAYISCVSESIGNSSQKMTNGSFWYTYIDNQDPQYVLYQEKALMIEQQLTEYWNQAYIASKYCDWFLPSNWTPTPELKKNSFFQRLFTINDNKGTIEINKQFIPEVSVVGDMSTTKRPSYQITYDPFFMIPDAGDLASDIEKDNLAFRALSNELLGDAIDNLSKFKLNKTENTTTYYYVKSGGCRWKNILSYIGQSSTVLEGFSGLYGLMFKWSNNFIDNPLTTYNFLLDNKKSIWKELHSKYPYIFYEGVFEYATATTSEELYQMSYYAFKDKSQPETEYSITILDAYSLKGYSGEDIKIGYPILVDATEYQLENIQAQKAIDQYLFITDVSYSLRSDLNISLTVNSVKYDDKLIERLVKFIR